MSAAPLSLHLGPSRVLALLLVLVHLLALLALAVSLDGLPLVLASAGATLSAALTAAEAMQQRANSPTEIDLKSDGRAAWRNARGRWHEGELAKGGFASTWLILVPLSGPGWRRKWVVVGPDAASADDRRRLRVWLRWRHGRADPAAE